MKNCIFCSLGSDLQSPHILFHNNNAFAVKDIAPKAPVHYLIIPQKHIQDIRSIENNDNLIAADILMLAHTIAHTLPGKPDFRLVVNNGKSAGQSVFHLHMHFLSGFSHSSDTDFLKKPFIQ